MNEHNTTIADCQLSIRGDKSVDSHFKVVKRANITLACKSALEKSCARKMKTSFTEQVQLFLSAG